MKCLLLIHITIVYPDLDTRLEKFWCCVISKTRDFSIVHLISQSSVCVLKSEEELIAHLTSMSQSATEENQHARNKILIKQNIAVVL